MCNHVQIKDAEGRDALDVPDDPNAPPLYYAPPPAAPTTTYDSYNGTYRFATPVACVGFVGCFRLAQWTNKTIF